MASWSIGRNTCHDYDVVSIDVCVKEGSSSYEYSDGEILHRIFNHYTEYKLFLKRNVDCVDFNILMLV